MRTLVKSLKRLYDNGKISKGKITEMLESGKITAEEYRYIVGDEA